MSPEDLAWRFDYHPPKDDDTRRKHEGIRELCGVLAEGINSLVPEGREKALALTKLEEAMFWANAAVARNS